MLDHIAGTTIVSLDGSFDLAQRGKMSDAFSAALGSHLIVVDCLRATYLDSTALGCILRLRREAIENHRELVVVASSSRVKKLFELSGLANFVEMRGSVEEIGGDRIAGHGDCVQWIDLVSEFSD